MRLISYLNVAQGSKIRLSRSDFNRLQYVQDVVIASTVYKYLCNVPDSFACRFKTAIDGVILLRNGTTTIVVQREPTQLGIGRTGRFSKSEINYPDKCAPAT